MAQANIDINVNSKSLGELEKDLANLNEEIKKVGVGSAEFKKLSKQIQDVQGQVDKANSAIKGLDVGQLVGEIGKVAAGIGAAGIALSTFAGENEDVQAALEKTNAILALAATAEAIYTATKKEGAIATAASSVATLAASAAQGIYTLAVGSSTGALKLLRIALVSTGIGAIVVLIGLAIAYWDEWTSAIYNSEEGLTTLGKVLLGIVAVISGPIGIAIGGLILLFDEIAEQIGGWQNLLAAFGGFFKTFFTEFVELASQLGEIIAGIFTLDFDRIEAGYEKAKAILVKGVKDAVAEAEAERRKLQEIEFRKENQANLDRNVRRLQAQQAGDDKIYQAQKKALENQLRLAELEHGKQSDEYKDFQIDLLKLTTDYENQRAKEEEEARKKRRQDAKDANDALLTSELGLLKAREDNLNLSTEERLKIVDRNAEAEAKTIRETSKTAAEAENRKAKAALEFGAQRLKIVQEAQQKELDIIDQYTQLQLESLLKRAEVAGDVDEVARIQGEINALQEESTKKAEEASVAAKTRLDDLLAQGKLTKELYDQAIADISNLTTTFTTEISKATTEGLKSATESGLSNVTKIAEGTLQLTIDKLEKDIAVAEKELVETSENRRQKEKDTKDKILGFEKQILEAKIKTAEDALKATTLTTNERAALEKELAQLQLELAKKTQEANEAAAQTTQERFKQLQTDLQQIVEVLNAAFGLLQASINFTQSKLDAEAQAWQERTDAVAYSYDQEIAAAEKAGKDTTEIEKRKNQELLRLEYQKAQQEESLKISLANQNFALTIGQAIANGALAAIRALAELGPIAGPIAAALIAGTVGFQIATAVNARDTAISQARAATANAGRALNLAGGGGGGGQRTQFAEGGLVTGPGTGTSDSISARLSNGEFVVNAASTARFLPLLEQINSTPQRFANGGLATVNSASTPNLDRLLERLERRLATPPKAYVVSTEIKDALDTDDYLERRASLT